MPLSKVFPDTTYLLQHIPPVFSANFCDDSATSILITTADVSRFDAKKVEKPFSNSIQIIDADQPWPPRWYLSTPFYTDEMFNTITKQKQYRFDFLVDAKVESGVLSFYKILSQQEMGVGQLVAPEFAGYIILNKNYESVDTVFSKIKGFNMYYHDLRIDRKGERMVDMKKNVRLNLSQYTGDKKDSSINCNMDFIQILDTNNNVIFSWNPIKHIDPKLFQFKETIKGKAFASRHADIIEWTRLTSALWDYDGDILYAMKNIGIGKVSKKDGHVIWQINNNDLPFVSGNDTIEWYAPHDFNLLSETQNTVTYSLFSNGSEKKPSSGVIFEMDKKTQKINEIKYIFPKTSYSSDGQGNIEYHPNGNYSIGYGFFEKSDSNPGYRNALEYQKASGKFGVYKLPQWVYCYKARLIENWTKPPRPVIVKVGDSLSVKDYTTEVTWYKLSGKDNRDIVRAGSGRSLKYEQGVSYCVEQKYGIGFAVSRIFKN